MTPHSVSVTVCVCTPLTHVFSVCSAGGQSASSTPTGSAASQNPALAAAVSQGTYAMHGSPLPPQGPQVQATPISQGSPAPPPASVTPTSSTPSSQTPQQPPTPAGSTGGDDPPGTYPPAKGSSSLQGNVSSAAAAAKGSPPPSLQEEGDKSGKACESTSPKPPTPSQAPVLTDGATAGSKSVESSGSQTVEDPGAALQPPHLEPEGPVGSERLPESSPAPPVGLQPAGVEGQGQSACGMVAAPGMAL